MGIDQAGTVTIVYAGQGGHAFATRSVAGGSFATAEPIAPGLPGHMDDRCVMAIGSDGTVTVVWPQRDRTPEGKHETRVVWTQLLAGADTWTEPRYLTRAGRNTDYFLWLSIAPDDSLLLVWQGWFAAHSRLLLAHSTRWSVPRTVSRNQFLDDVVNLGGGTATAMFERIGPRERGTRIVTTQRRPDGTWQPLQPIAPHRKGYQSGEQLSSWRHRTIALWEVGRYLEVSIRRHGRWGHPHDIFMGQGEGWSAQAYPDGAIRVVWTKETKTRVGSRGQLLTAVRGRHGSWGTTSPITQLAVDSPAVQLLAHHSAAVLYSTGPRIMFSEVAPPTG